MMCMIVIGITMLMQDFVNQKQQLRMNEFKNREVEQHLNDVRKQQESLKLLWKKLDIK